MAKWPRSEFSRKTRAAAFARCGGVCEECGAHLYPGKFQYDHKLASWLGGEATLENCDVLCTACHSAKTGKRDAPMIAKTRKLRDSHIGAKPKSKTPMPFGKGSAFKRKMDGTIVPRSKCT